MTVAHSHRPTSRASRTAGHSAGNYRQHRCHHKGCEPCKQRYGSCVGLDNGLQPHPGLEWTARHLVCEDQRAIHQMDCPQEKPVFSPETRRCESLLDIPKAHGGFQPSCEGRHDGRYPDETGRCDVFYECADNVIQGRFQCPSGTVFHPERQTCRRKNSRGGSGYMPIRVSRLAGGSGPSVTRWVWVHALSCLSFSGWIWSLCNQVGLGTCPVVSLV